MKKVKHIYMNHRIKDKKPGGPVITVQQGKRVRYSNNVRIVVDGRIVARVIFKSRGLKTAPYHDVRAYIETSEEVRM